MSRHPLASWLPHLVLIALVIASVGWLLTLLAPVTKALVVGASLALLTHGVLYRRILDLLIPWWPWLVVREQVAAFAALGVLVACAAGAGLALMWAALGGLSLTLGAVWGLAIQDPDRIQQVIDRLTARGSEVLALYPALPLTTDDIRGWIVDLLHQTAVGPVFLRTVVTGGGGAVIEIILTLIFTWWLYVHGPALGRRLLALIPREQRSPMADRLRMRAGALVLGTFGRAFVIGVMLGLVAWLVGGFHPVLVAAVAIIVGVMPLLGPFFVWLPLASLLASQGHWTQAVLLALLSQAGVLVLSRLLDRRTATAPLRGTGPVLLLTLVGGLWGYGARGLILAPAALLLALSAWDALASLYAQSPSEDGEPAVGHA